MFGYIIVNRQEMKLRDFETYQSYYCGFCRKLKERYKARGQLTLSYDMTFLILLLKGLYEETDQMGECKCIAHPLEKHTTRVNRFTDYAADMNIILTYYHCMDDWQDERKLLKKGYAGILKKSFRAAELKYPEKADMIARQLRQIGEYEKTGERDLDRVAGCFGNIMAEIFACSKDEWEEELRTMGFFLGKFIYLMDAYEDVEKDRKKHQYNPLAESFGKEGFEEACSSMLNMMMSECAREFEKLPILQNAEILRNILYSGVWVKHAAIWQKRIRTREESKK